MFLIGAATFFSVHRWQYHWPLGSSKKKNKPNPGAVTRRDQSNQGKKYFSLNSPQVKHNHSPINRTSVLMIVPTVYGKKGCICLL